MPNNNASDLITDLEIAFAHLVFSGTMTDRRAAEAVGLNPDTAAYIKSKPCVCAYMLEHRAAVQQPLVEQDTEEQRRFNLSRDRVLARLWQIADLDPEMTRNSASSQEPDQEREPMVARVRLLPGPGRPAGYASIRRHRMAGLRAEGRACSERRRRGGPVSGLRWRYPCASRRSGSLGRNKKSRRGGMLDHLIF